MSQAKKNGQHPSGCCPFVFPSINFEKEDAMAQTLPQEVYTYQVDKMKFIVTPVYKEDGEPMWDILLKLMLAELDTV